jgi:hypothetical protein
MRRMAGKQRQSAGVAPCWVEELYLRSPCCHNSSWPCLLHALCSLHEGMQ